MNTLKAAAFLVPVLLPGAVACSEQSRSQEDQALEQTAGTPMGWGRWRMGQMWGMGPMWEGPGPMPRHHVAMMWGIPEPYISMANPLPHTQESVERGASVYAENCEACHGKEGYGDGEAGRDLSPPPGNLAWLSDMPIGQWDPFIYWTVAEGGSQFGTAMPAFKDSLTKDEIWEVAAYIQAHLPQDEKGK